MRFRGPILYMETVEGSEVGRSNRFLYLHRFSFKRRRSQWRSCFRQLPVPPALSRRVFLLLRPSRRMKLGSYPGIDVDAVRNESQNSLSEPSVQFVTVSSVVGERSNSNIFSTSQALRRELEMAETRFLYRIFLLVIGSSATTDTCDRNIANTRPPPSLVPEGSV